jgi:hypothetical protein
MGFGCPLPLVEGPGGLENGNRVIRELGEPSPTREGADAIATKLAIEWIDSQFPSASD